MKCNTVMPGVYEEGGLLCVVQQLRFDVRQLRFDEEQLFQPILTPILPLAVIYP